MYEDYTVVGQWDEDDETPYVDWVKALDAKDAVVATPAGVRVMAVFSGFLTDLSWNLRSSEDSYRLWGASQCKECSISEPRRDLEDGDGLCSVCFRRESGE